jgi:hypothetical protein
MLTRSRTCSWDGRKRRRPGRRISGYYIAGAGRKKMQGPKRRYSSLLKTLGRISNSSTNYQEYACQLTGQSAKNCNALDAGHRLDMSIQAPYVIFRLQVPDLRCSIMSSRRQKPARRVELGEEGRGRQRCLDRGWVREGVKWVFEFHVQ